MPKLGGHYDSFRDAGTATGSGTGSAMNEGFGVGARQQV